MSTGFIGSNLRLARLFHDLSLTDLGDKVGVSKQFLSRIETGAEAASAQLQASLAQELQVLPDFFFIVSIPTPSRTSSATFVASSRRR